MLSIRIHHGGKFQRYPGRIYVSGRFDIFDMVAIDLFTVVALNMMVLKLGYTGESEPMFYNYLRPFTSLDEGLDALACEEDDRCLDTLVMSFKLIEVIDYVIRQLSLDETKLDGEAGFVDVAGSGMDYSGLSHDESFRVDDLDLNLNETINLNVSQVETQSELPVSEEPDVEVSTEAPIVKKVGTQEFNVEDVVIEDYVRSGEDAEQGNGHVNESAPTDGHEDAGKDDDDDVDEDFLVDKENEIVEPDVDVHLFGISMDLYFDNIGITNLVPDDILEGEDVDVISADGFDSNPGTGPTGLNRRMEAGPSGSSGPTTRSKKRKNTGTNEDSQASPSFLDTHNKGDLCPWFLVNPNIPVKAVQDQLQRELEVQISMSKAFKAKTKVEREISGYHVLYVWVMTYICIPIQISHSSVIDRRAKSDLLLNNICEVFNGKIVGRRDKPVITLLEYIREYCMKRIVNVQGMIDKCIGPLTPTATRIMKSIDEVQWNGVNNTTPRNLGKSLLLVEYMEENILAQDTTNLWDQVPGKVNMSNNTFATQVSCLGGNNAEGSDSASRQAQQTQRAVSLDGLGGSGAGAVIGLSAVAGEGGACDQGGADITDASPPFRVSTNGLGGGGYLRDYVRIVVGMNDGDSNSDLLLLTSWSDESKNEKRKKRCREEFKWKRSLFEIDLMFGINAFDLDKGTDVMKDKVRQKNVCEEEVPLNNNIGKQIDHFVDMPSEAIEQGMDATVPDEIAGVKGEQVPNHVVKKDNLEFLVCKDVANPDVNELVDKRRPLKRKRVYAEYMSDAFIEDEHQCK
uniref:PB1-like domain-containing protein n=1 Tax=Tanacetum cinerariifolium TaxID=118510 RepID=A0A699GM57_TANCI|nr:hypothetical protein [Tanacetum cinerariifolium]